MPERRELRREPTPPRLLRLQKLTFAVALALSLASTSCARQTKTSSTTATLPDGGAPLPPAERANAPAPSSGDAGRAPAEEARIDPDGNDEPEDPGEGKAPTSGRWEKVGTPPLALTRICDLTPFGGSLYAAHANQPLGTDGATITRYDPTDEKRPFRVAFDWNRPGEPTKGGGGGQGFIRVHAIGNKLYVPDADPPYGGLGLVDGAEGYVFRSDEAGVFAPPGAPHFRPPKTAAILPRAYHVIDVVRFRGALYASTGSVPPKERAWRGPSPGALHRANDDGTRWLYETDYPFPWQNGVWRLTFLVRFRDRLYAGIQDYDGRDPNDFVYFTPSASPDGGATILRHEDAHPTRITRVGASGTLRWWVDTKVRPARLYWLAWTRDGIALHVTSDGDHWAIVAMPDDAGRVADVTRFRDSVVALTERGLYRLSGKAIDGQEGVDASEGVADANADLIAPIVDPSDPKAKKAKSPFEVSDFFCTAPLAVFKNALYAGGQRGGTLYRLAE